MSIERKHAYKICFSFERFNELTNLKGKNNNDLMQECCFRSVMFYKFSQI